ncbi:fungal-specific transcription factor domain-containing protein [Cristinia sonorae]|uniref:Fungal-specific transcription factor domain-containing protein n=1 Tax=Cristinia sonorae TaxID=1940300 RepID=A0A8K0UYI8_9AGAR|nr:fungal-specific transcription factor domain-containing protein [Cristinia sonorae]
MKCVGGEEGVKPCQRCKRSGSECIFEKHRRGRKPGSKLSEASRVLRHLEKGLTDAKLKSQVCPSPPPTHSSPSLPPPSMSYERFPNNELPPLKLPPDFEPGSSRLVAADFSDRREQRQRDQMDVDDEGDAVMSERSSNDGVYPAQLIRQEAERTTFFKTILNPEPADAPVLSPHSHLPSRSRSPSPTRSSFGPPSGPPSELRDPISAGIIDIAQAGVFFDLFFLRLNPFINLFDPALHTVHYVRSHCPFLFTTIIMVCCKFFKHNLYHATQQLAQEFAVRAFAESWTRIEVVQAFACLTYWQEPGETRTWTYIGFASRMAIELGLNRYSGKRLGEESEMHARERRNRERTYLVLFVHDRSLSIQTGRHWMLPEDDIVRHSVSWHSDGPLPVRPEDVIVTAFTQLQRIAAESTEAFHSQKGGSTNASQEDIFRLCNGKLSQWTDTWHHEMRRANGGKFHYALLNLFRLHVRLFLNSFAVQPSLSSSSRVAPSPSALSACYTSALEILQIVVKELAGMSMLRYSQESLTLVTAYASVFLLKLLRSPATTAELHEGAAEEIRSHIFRVSEAYYEVSTISSVMSSAGHHARFLRGLVEEDMGRGPADHPRRSYLSGSFIPHSAMQSNGLPAEPQEYRHRSTRLPGAFSIPSVSSHRHPPSWESHRPDHSQHHLPRGASEEKRSYASPALSHCNSRGIPASESDQNYYKNDSRKHGHGEGTESSAPGHPSSHTPSSYGNDTHGCSTGTSPLSRMTVPLTSSRGKPPLGHHEERSSQSHGRPVYSYADRQQSFSSSNSSYA